VSERDERPPETEFEPIIKIADLDARIREAPKEWDQDVREVNAGWATHAGPRLQACQETIDQLARFHADVQL
jgi:hypothetical protein